MAIDFMNRARTCGGRMVLASVVWGLWVGPMLCLSAAGDPPADEIRIVQLQGQGTINGTMQVLPPGAVDWVSSDASQVLRPGWRVRIGPNTRVTLRWSDQSVVSFKQLAEFEILPPDQPKAQAGLRLFKGIFSFFHRDKPSHIRIISRGASAGVDGTEFVMAIEMDGNVEQTRLSVIDGRVTFGAGPGALSLTNLEEAVAVEGQPPKRTAGFIANNVLQWCFYYPAVLDLRDLPLTTEMEQALADSLAAYRTGDLLAALAKYPNGRQLASDAERVYRAALLLSVGEVGQTEGLLGALPAGDPSDRLPRLANALRQLIAAVKRQERPATLNPQFSTELLAASYYEQSRAVRETALRSALDLARKAANTSPEFGFAWARVAELEFSFGRTSRALEALNQALTLTSRNAQALALRGFLLAAQNKTHEAIDSFNQAIAVDGNLGNAWLGRGLCRIRRGDRQGGREDLLVAAALEPQRAFTRSYLGKAYADAGDRERAAYELALAKNLDPNDPTAWLYSALLLQQENRINEAVDDLEQSQELNDNRRLYRSKLLLDQDRAVGSANLANIYRDAGMADWSVREAGRAVASDYANYSAHLFLANSYDELRDPNRINLRYETPAESEYLIANLLAPVGAGLLAQSVSQQEYSKLFERDRLGVTSSTEYLSRGAWVEHGAQFGTFRNSSYLFEGFYRWDPGQRPNNDFEETQLRLHLKQQITPQDTLYFQAIQYDAEGGDVIQYYDPTGANLGLRTKETQQPIVHLGYHHEWSPGVHTLLVAGRLQDTYSVAHPLRPALLLTREDDGTLAEAHLFLANLDYRSRQEIYTAEVQQIWEEADHRTIIGGRFQMGEFEVDSLQTNPVYLATETEAYFDPTAPLARQPNVHTDFQRWSVYGYHSWQVLPALQLIGGLSYDQLLFPDNFRAPPVWSREKSTQRWSPKAGLIWTPRTNLAARFAYTRSLAGASLDQGILLEPSQVAGFNQSFRSIIPESIAGANSGARFETFGLALEQKFDTGTYLGLSGQLLNSEVERTVGVFDWQDSIAFFARPSGTPNSLDYTERSLLVAVNQLVQKEWAFGASYRLTQANLLEEYNAVPPGTTIYGGFRPSQDLSAVLHQVGLQTTYYNPSGFFAQFQAQWYQQSNQGYSPSLPSDEFWQFNVFAGYRFPRRKAELRVGLLNLTDQDYRLNPLTLYNELPRERTLALRLQFSF